MPPAATVRPNVVVGFHEFQGRRQFYLRAPVVGEPRCRVLVAPPFAEELNKCRRIVGLTVRALAAAGCDVLYPDLFGTGDSAGDFGEADWTTWLADWRSFAAWHADLAPASQPAILAVRSGALLLDGGLPPALDGARIVCWQPVLDGARFLQQFLRLRVVAQRIGGSNESLADLERSLETTGSVEVAGYTLSAALAHGLASASLQAGDLAAASLVDVLEFKSGTPAVTVPSQKFVAALTDLGVAAAARCISAEQFWSTQEISAPPVVVDSTVAAFAHG